MMKYLCILSAFFLLIIEIKAQTTDTASVVKIVDVYQKSPKIIEFSITMQRASDSWSRWANSTYSITFNDTTFKFDKNNLRIEFIDSPDIKFSTNKSAPLPINKYSVITQVDPQRMIIYFLGPEDFANAISIPKDTVLYVGNFRITLIDDQVFPQKLPPPQDSLPFKVIWSQPFWRVQAIAYKTDVNLLENNTVMFSPNDNKDFLNPLGDQSKGIFLEDNSTKPEMKLIYFSARYTGGFNVRLDWEMKTELNNDGFILTRALLPFGKKDFSNVAFLDTIAFFDRTVKGTYDPYLRQKDMLTKGAGTTVKPTSYTVADTAQRRALNYAYKLSYRAFDSTYTDLASRIMLVPNATIESAIASPNPFERRTQIEYTVKDNVTMTAKLYDLNGKELMTIMNAEVKKLGTYIFDLNMPQFATQGLYDLRFFATPIDDPTVEDSRASVRLQMIR